MKHNIIIAILIAITCMPCNAVSIQELIDAQQMPAIKTENCFLIDHREDLVVLDLTKMNITSLDGLLAVPGIYDVQKLILTNNRLGELTAKSFGKLPNLRVLILTGCRINSIEPGTFAGLRALEELQIITNKLNTLAPKIFSGLPHLRVLSLNFNMIKTIEPKTFHYLPALEELRLASNQLTEINQEIIPASPTLRALELDNNLLKNFTKESLPYLPKLAFLWLQDNKFSERTKQFIYSMYGGITLRI